MLTKLLFAGIPVHDQDRALAFYTQKLGFELRTDSPMGAGQRWIELAVPGAETRVVLYTPQGHEDRVGTFFNGAFETDDLAATYEDLKARGVEFTQPPKGESWGSMAIFKDSEGNSFVLSQRERRPGS